MNTPVEQDDVLDVVIVGSGPSGYTAAIYTARASLSPVVVAGSVTAGGELMNTTEVENFPGFPAGIMGPELMGNLQEQAERFDAKVLMEDAVELRLGGDVKEVVLGNGETLRAKAVIVSTGSAYRHLGVPGEERLSGHGVSWCATCDGFFFREADLVVVGGGDSAMEEAMFLTKFAKSVTVVHRRGELRASKIMQQRARANEKISFLFDTAVTSINGQEKVSSVSLRNLATGEESELPVTGVFIAIGHDPRVELVKDQLELDPEGTIAVRGRSSATSLPGVFAAGDVVDHTYRQAITAAGSGCVAAIDVEHYLAALESAEPAAAL